MLSACLFIYVARATPFLVVRSGMDRLPVSEAVVTRLWTDSLTGPKSSRNLAYHVACELPDPSPGLSGKGILSRDEHQALGTGSVVSVVSWRNRILLADDLRWDPLHRRKYWLMLAAGLLFGLESARRCVLFLGQMRE